MTNEDGPWRRDKPTPPPGRGRPGLWLLLLAGLAGLVFALAQAFPGAVRTPGDWASVAYGVGLLVVLLSAGLLRTGQGGLAQHLRHAAIWVGIVAVLALGVAYWDVLAAAPRRLMLAFSGGDPVAMDDHELVIPRNEQGAFIVVGRVNGERVRFLVDTGASETVLSPDDARRLGVDVDRLSHDYEAETANGVGRGAPFTAARLEVGPIGVDDFNMVINQAPMSQSLLGLSFLDRLESFEVRGAKLTLRWRDGAL